MQLYPPRLSPTRRSLYLGCAAFCLCALAYAGALGGPFLWDDRALILGEPAVQRPGPLLSYFLQPFWRPQADVAAPRHMYRPLVTLSYVADRVLHGENPVGFHLTNVLFHVLNAGLLLLLLRRGGAPPGVAALGAGLWALFPRLTESVTWISGRTDVLAATFILAALLCCPPGAAARRRWAGAGLLLLGLLCKEVAAAGVLAIVAGEAATGRRGLGRRLLPLLCAGLAYGALRVLALRAEPPAPPSVLGPWQRGLTALEAMGTYLLMVLDAWRPQTQIGLLGRPHTPSAVLGAIAAAAALACAPRLRRLPAEELRAVVLGAGALALVLHVAPLPVDVVAADRFLYVPLMGLTLLLGRLRPPRALLVAGAALALSFAAAVHLRNRAFGDEVAFWLDALRHSHPENGRPLLELGNVYYRAGLYDDAQALYRRAAAAARGNGAQAGLPESALGNVANCLSQRGRYEEALALHRALLRKAPAVPKHHLDLGLVFLHAGRYSEARAALGTAQRLLPTEAARAAIEAADWAEKEEARLLSAPDAVARAEWLTHIGRRPEAQAAWLAVARRPGAPAAELERAAALLLLLGPTEAAEEAVRRHRAATGATPVAEQLAVALAERAERERRLRAAGAARQGAAAGGGSAGAARGCPGRLAPRAQKVSSLAETIQLSFIPSEGQPLGVARWPTALGAGRRCWGSTGGPGPA